MRVYARTGRRTGVSVGPIGLMILGPIYLTVWMLYAAVYAVGWCLALLILTWKVSRR